MYLYLIAGTLPEDILFSNSISNFNIRIGMLSGFKCVITESNYLANLFDFILLSILGGSNYSYVVSQSGVMSIGISNEVELDVMENNFNLVHFKPLPCLQFDINIDSTDLLMSKFYFSLFELPSLYRAI